jgi:hypothetical protein
MKDVESEEVAALRGQKDALRRKKGRLRVLEHKGDLGLLNWSPLSQSELRASEQATFP